MKQNLTKDQGTQSLGARADLSSSGSPVNASRRRFARAGAGTPVVLGSLLSKPALGAPAGYDCTISGQLSGNTSSHPENDVCTSLGDGPDTWFNAAATSWPVNVTKGTLPAANGNNCSFNGQTQQGTLFNGYTNGGETIVGTFYFASSNNPACALNTSSGSAATMLQVLKLASDNGGLNDLGREIVAAILSSLKSAEYPVRARQLIAMFNATKVAGGFYFFPGTTRSWNRAEVLTYLKKLHP